MQCPRCQHDNRPGARFCEECAAPLARACGACGAPLSPTAKFCPACAHPAAAPPPQPFDSPERYTPKHLAERILTSRAAVEGERKQVTVLFADLKGSMELLADRDPEEARELLDPVLERMMEAVHRYEGTVNQVMGDGIMALFGAPIAQEDHAPRACFAALRMQEAVGRYAEDLRRTHGVDVQIRVGLNSGDVVVRSIGNDLRMDYSAVGQTTHLAARMEQLARPGSTLMTQATLRGAEGYVQVRSLGPMPIKGLPEPVAVYEVIGAGTVRTRLQASVARGLTRFVGRDAEIDQLRQALEAAGRGRGEVVAVVGEPGVGKSRLFYEFIHSHRTQGWLVLESSSVSYGKAAPWLPLVDLLKSYFKIADRDDTRAIRAKVTGILLTLDEALQESIAPVLWLLDVLPDDHPFLRLDRAARRTAALEAVRRVLLRESASQPILLVFEDLHWIDAETQAFLDAIVESLRSAPVLLAVNYRPEYRHAWGSKTYYRQLRIDVLPPATAEALLEPLLGGDASLAPLRRLLVERTEGNPLFLEESVRALVETEVLVGERGAYRLVKDPGAVQVPPTVQAILAARIDRLPPTTSGCSRRRRSSARTCRGRCCSPSRSYRRRSSGVASGTCRPRSSCTKRSSSRTSSTRSSTRSPTRSPTAASCTIAGVPCTVSSSAPSSACTPTAWPSTPSSSPTTRSGASSGRRRCTIWIRPERRPRSRASTPSSAAPRAPGTSGGAACTSGR